MKNQKKQPVKKKTISNNKTAEHKDADINDKNPDTEINKLSYLEENDETPENYSSFDYKKGYTKSYKKCNHKYATPIIAFYIIAMVTSIIACCIPLIWIIPMFIYYKKCVKLNKSLGDGFIFSTFLFVSLAAGVLLICDA